MLGHALSARPVPLLRLVRSCSISTSRVCGGARAFRAPFVARRALVVKSAATGGADGTVSAEEAQKDAALAYKKRAEESAAAGVNAWRPPKGGDPPPPPGEPWAWTLNWDPVIYDEQGALKVIVGSCPKCAADLDRLVDEAGAEAILCLQSDDCFEAMGIDSAGVRLRAQQRGVLWTRVAVRDFDRIDQGNMLPDMCTALATLVASGRTAYVHCTAGINRATLTALAYLTWVQGMEYDAALALLKAARPQAQPYRVSWDLATARLLSGRGDELYCRATLAGASRDGGGDWIARDMAAAKRGALQEAFRRRVESNLELLGSATAVGGLGRSTIKAAGVCGPPAPSAVVVPPKKEEEKKV